MGLATALGWAARGYFIPYRYAASIPEPPVSDAYPELARAFKRAEPGFESLIYEIDRHAETLRGFTDARPPEPRWRQSWFPRLDGAAAYAMVRRRRPRRIVEIGSGHSTRFLARAARDGGLDTRIAAIDPAPRASLADLAVEHVAATLHAADFAIFGRLAAGDFLFVDSSHILMPGSDVDLVINRIWPALPPGVVVHFHDIFLPDGYPAEWRWRGYNEQSGVAALIAAGGAAVLFSSHYAATRMPDRLGKSVVAELPIEDGAVETSLWLEKRM